MILSAAIIHAFVAVGCGTQAAAPAAEERKESVAARGAGHPADELADLDPRKPVPLQPMMAWHQKQNMMEHLVAIQRITDGLAREDWDEIATAASLIESSPQMQQMCQHMGAGADGFTELALDFHRRADAIGQAARARDGVAVLGATANTLQACTGCHAAYRQEVVDAATYQARTGRAHDPAAMHGGH
ncbi:MAG: hypothetical protein K8M05_02400 [Deltaproteobacteria bacterium]|nr:hypothetical protein [Kofleriaceae bacterium]